MYPLIWGPSNHLTFGEITLLHPCLKPGNILIPYSLQETIEVFSDTRYPASPLKDFVLRYDTGIDLYPESGFLCHQSFPAYIYPGYGILIAAPRSIAAPGYLARLLLAGEVSRHRIHGIELLLHQSLAWYSMCGSMNIHVDGIQP